ncbi:MAG: 5'/3'-nucleotidase SurE [Alphaproteobacteria bacterium]|nr:5'/3'-nucleotidase SurE [Alphaproteobacteria bacterium]
MFAPIEDVSKCRILVANDDGIHGPGLAVMEEIVSSLSDDVWIVAPETEQSGAAHSLTLTRPLRVREIAEKKFAVDGTPADCVLVACNKLMKDGKKPDIVLSGVNKGANLGDDVTYSGTIAAAMEGTLLDIHSVALSLVCARGAIAQWDVVRKHGADVIKSIMSVGWNKNVLVNVNFPDVENPDDVSGIEVVSQGKRMMDGVIDERVDPRHRPYIWICGTRVNDYSRQDTDISAIARKAITVTPLCMDLTHAKTLERMQGVFKGFGNK